jgi:hypothetical protein
MAMTTHFHLASRLKKEQSYALCLHPHASPSGWRCYLDALRLATLATMSRIVALIVVTVPRNSFFGFS